LLCLLIVFRPCRGLILSDIRTRRRRFVKRDHPSQLSSGSLDRTYRTGIQAHGIQDGSIESASHRMLEEIETQEQVRRSSRPLTRVLVAKRPLSQADVSLRGQRGQKGSPLWTSATFRFDQEPGHPRRHRQLEHAPPCLGERAPNLAVIHCPELNQKPFGAGERCSGRRVEPRKLTWVGKAPASYLEYRTAEIQA
jgi:hypothetical protein